MKLTWEEVLRTVGAWLDAADYALAVIDLSPTGIVSQTVGPAGHDEFRFDEIALHSRAQARLRGQGSAPRVAAPRRMEGVLRVVGAELDRVGQSRYGLTVSRSSVTVDGADGYHRVFDADTLARLLRRARCRRKKRRAAG